MSAPILSQRSGLFYVAATAWVVRSPERDRGEPAQGLEAREPLSRGFRQQRPDGPADGLTPPAPALWRSIGWGGFGCSRHIPEAGGRRSASMPSGGAAPRRPTRLRQLRAVACRIFVSRTKGSLDDAKGAEFALLRSNSAIGVVTFEVAASNPGLPLMKRDIDGPDTARFYGGKRMLPCATSMSGAATTSRRSRGPVDRVRGAA
jgi:hypothetical protein